jgi:hypothetical protein
MHGIAAQLRKSGILTLRQLIATHNTFGTHPGVDAHRNNAACIHAGKPGRRAALRPPLVLSRRLLALGRLLRNQDSRKGKDT